MFDAIIFLDIEVCPRKAIIEILNPDNNVYPDLITEKIPCYKI